MAMSSLQWGLGFLPEEIYIHALCHLNCALLQWGLGFLPEEISVLASTANNTPSGFNGASGFYPRKSEVVSVDLFEVKPASMGPRVFTRGNMLRKSMLCRKARKLQWGLGFLPEEISSIKKPIE